MSFQINVGASVDSYYTGRDVRRHFYVFLVVFENKSPAFLVSKFLGENCNAVSPETLTFY